ncbi:hypothetical protein EDB83DRAFT_2316751 [Lactarius deliciosus]|nr:hypothetical protein EDB83DRAFT_2316751 [Lactarius deliciosus]
MLAVLRCSPRVAALTQTLAFLLFWNCTGRAGPRGTRNVAFRVTKAAPRRVQAAKAARKCGDVGSDYSEPAGSGVAMLGATTRSLLGRVIKGHRKQLRTLLRGAKLRICVRLYWEHVGLKQLRPRASAARLRVTTWNLLGQVVEGQVRVAKAACKCAPQLSKIPATSSPLPESSPLPPTDTEDTLSPAPHLAHVRTSLKWPSTATIKSYDSVITVSSTSDDTSEAVLVPPKFKKPKMSPTDQEPEVHTTDTNFSIIDIDDIEDLENEHLNKLHPSADIKHFFMALPCSILKSSPVQSFGHKLGNQDQDQSMPK